MSSIFKTGTFGFSTVLSTPCDLSSNYQEHPSVGSRHSSKSLVDGLLNELSPASSNNQWMPHNFTSATQSSQDTQSNYADERYDEIYESYSKIWRDANLAEFERCRENWSQSATDQSQQQHYSAQFYSKFQLPHQACQTPNQLVHKQIRPSQEEVLFFTDVSSQSAIEGFKRRMQQYKGKEDKANVAQIAQMITQSFKGYSTRVTNVQEKLKITQSACVNGKDIRDTKLTPSILSTRCPSQLTSRFSSPTIVPSQYYQPNQQVQYYQSSSTTIQGKHMTRQHLVENIRQPLFPIKTINENTMARHKSSFDYDEKTPAGVYLGKGRAQALEVSSHKTQAVGGVYSNDSSRTKGDEEHEFDLSFEEDFFFDLQRGGIDLDE